MAASATQSFFSTELRRQASESTARWNGYLHARAGAPFEHSIPVRENGRAVRCPLVAP